MLFLIISVLLWNLPAIFGEVACSLSLTSTPLMVYNDKYHFPLSETLDLHLYQKFFVRCPPGTSNSYLHEDGEQLSCEGNTTVRIDRLATNVKFEELDCSNPSRIIVQKTNITCSPNAVEVRVGFEILQIFNPIYEVCFDEKHLVPVEVTLLELEKLEPFSYDLRFFVDNGGLYRGTDVYRLYNNQSAIFEELGLPGYIDDQIKLIPGPLLSANLFSSPLMNEALFDYVDVVPWWNTLYLEFSELLGQFNAETSLSFKTLGVATLPDRDGHLIELYLSDGKVPIPRWIDLRLEGSNSVLFYNNPFFEKSDLREELGEMCTEFTDNDSDTLFYAVCKRIREA